MAAPNASALSGSLEDYIEAIYHLEGENRVARAKDIGARLGVRGSSVTGALRSLAARKLVNYAPYEVITLTAEGEAIARDVVQRHEVLRDFFVRVLAVNEEDANDAACQIEHAISPVVFQRFVEFVEFLETCPRAGNKWIEGFGFHCGAARTKEGCERCIKLCLTELPQDPEQKKENKVVTLKTLKPGQKGRVVKVRRGGAIHKRIVDMGVTPGTVIEVRRIAPLGDPVEVKLRGYNLSLRKEEIGQIVVEQV